MSKSMKKIITRVIKARMAEGETFDEIIETYPKLTDSEIKELRKEFEV